MLKVSPKWLTTNRSSRRRHSIQRLQKTLFQQFKPVGGQYLTPSNQQLYNHKVRMLYKTCVYAITWSAVATGVWTKLTLVKHSKCLPSSNVVTGPYKLQSNTEYNWHTRKTVPSPVQRRRLTPKVCHQRRGCRHHTRARHPESQQLVSFCHYFSYLVVFSIRFIASPSPGIVKVVQPTTYGPFASQWGFFHDGDSKSHAHLNKASSAVSDSFTFVDNIRYFAI